jgi:hypothetical protein
VQRFQAPKKRLKTLLDLLGEVSTTAERSLFEMRLPVDEAAKRLVMFDAGVLLRASNALKAVRLLCEQAHWEFAAAILRQLFELVINVEHIGAQPDRDNAIFRYSKYGLFQTTRHQHLTLLYNKKTGRDVDTRRLAVLERMLEETFPEFRRGTDKGTVHWLTSWSGHTARYLSERSSHRLRVDQYELLFSEWSEQAHGAPTALMANMFPRDVPAEQIIASDDAEIIQTVTMAIALFFELWILLPHIPQIDPQQRLTWTNTMIAEARKHGAPIPPLPAG